MHVYKLYGGDLHEDRTLLLNTSFVLVLLGAVAMQHNRIIGHRCVLTM